MAILQQFTELFLHLVDIFLHLDQYLGMIIQSYGTLTYAILFGIVFAETGLVVMPFLPGDSLLFAAGAFAATGVLDIKLLLVSLSAAAILGDTLNYSIGKFIGHRIYEQEMRFIKKEHLLKTRHFYEKYGTITIVIARFMPIIRTFAPFVAGVGEMRYVKFTSFNITGGILWVALFCAGGYFFGNLPLVKKNFSLVIIAVVVLSVLPVIIGWFKQHSSSRVEGKGESL